METEKLIEKLSQEQKESSKVVRIALAYAEFASLVKRMREAQEEWLNINPFEDEEMEDVLSRIRQYESEVDEYLMKMEI